MLSVAETLNIQNRETIDRRIPQIVESRRRPRLYFVLRS